jgi:anti-sigma factor RsiW
MQQQMAAPKKRFAFVRLMPFAISLATVLLVAIAWMQHTSRADAFREVADLHVNALASSNPLDVVSTDRHTVKPWFQGRIPFSFNVPELAGSEFTLLGGRMVYLHQHPGAQLIVGMRQHKVSVLIFQEEGWNDSLALAGGVANRSAFNVTTWRSGGLRFFVIGDAEPAEIEKLAGLLKQANG